MPSSWRRRTRLQIGEGPTDLVGAEDERLSDERVPLPDSVTAEHLARDAVGPDALAALALDVDKYITSTTYIPGVAGWAIDANGNAEFNDVTARGVIEGATVKGTDGLNLWSNPSCAIDTEGYTPGTGCTIARTSGVWTNAAGVATSDTTALQFVVTGGDISARTDPIPVTPGRAYGLEGVANPGTFSGGFSFFLQIEWYDEAGTLLDTGDPTNNYIDGVEHVYKFPANGAPFFAPDTAAWAQLRIILSGGLSTQVAYAAGIRLSTVSDISGATLRVGDVSGTPILRADGVAGHGNVELRAATVTIGQASATIDSTGSLAHTGDAELTGHLSVGYNAPGARLHVVEGTPGEEVSRLATTTTGDQVSERVFQGKVSTTNATVTTLLNIAAVDVYADLSSASAAAYTFQAVVSARRTGGAAGATSDAAGYLITGLVKHIAGTATLVGSTVTPYESVGAYDCIADTSGGGLRFRVTGVANTNITWAATVRTYPVVS